MSVCNLVKALPYNRFYFIIDKIKPIVCNCLKKGDWFSHNNCNSVFLTHGKPIINTYGSPLTQYQG